MKRGMVERRPCLILLKMAINAPVASYITSNLLNDPTTSYKSPSNMRGSMSYSNAGVANVANYMLQNNIANLKPRTNLVGGNLPDGKVLVLLPQIFSLHIRIIRVISGQR